MKDVISGRWRCPRAGSARRGSLQNEVTARRLGFQGAIVPGSVHLEQFQPLLVELFGDAWWRQGCISMYCVSPTLDREPVCCSVEPLDDGRARIWLNGEGESLIMEGTAALGEDPASEVAVRLREAHAPEQLRVLARIQPGTTARMATHVAATRVDERLAAITEPMACYREPERFGGRVAPAALLVEAMRVVEPEIAPLEGLCVDALGAVELRYLNGPALAGVDYWVEGRVLALSESPRAEILWYQSDLYDAEERPVARMIRMNRLLKESSPRWSG